MNSPTRRSPLRPGCLFFVVSALLVLSRRPQAIPVPSCSHPLFLPALWLQPERPSPRPLPSVQLQRQRMPWAERLLSRQQRRAGLGWALLAHPQPSAEPFPSFQPQRQGQAMRALVGSGLYSPSVRQAGAGCRCCPLLRRSAASREHSQAGCEAFVLPPGWSPSRAIHEASPCSALP